MCCASWWRRRSCRSADFQVGQLQVTRTCRFGNRRSFPVASAAEDCYKFAVPNPPRSKREYLRELVADKNHWCGRQLTAEQRRWGFLGWHERGYLPHCDFPGLIQFVTFRLEDSMPASRRAEWEHLLKLEDVRDRRTKLEEYLDRGVGSCCLLQENVAQLAEAALCFEHQKSYELLAWSVMPNHIHVLVHIWRVPLWKLIKSWKQFVARQNNDRERRLPSRPVSSGHIEPVWKPAFRLKWQREYWDTFMRDEEQEQTAIRYIENNPVKAKLCRAAAWPFSSARFRDKHRRLALPEIKNPVWKGK